MKHVCDGCKMEITTDDYIVCGDYMCDENRYEYLLHKSDDCLLCFMKEHFLEASCTFEGEAYIKATE